MCGIAGAVGEDLKRVPTNLERLRHRGPDGHGLWQSRDGQACLAHTRLSILDLSSAAQQPMAAQAEDVAIVFNGEIYNFEEIRDELKHLGVVFKSTGDTEVLLQGYLLWGPKVLSKLRGMFAFAIWDARERKLFLARDRLGIKPLFWTLDKNTLKFSSELQGVLAQLGERPALRHEAVVEYLTWLYVPCPNTFYAGIQVLPPGHFLVWQPGTPQPEPQAYWKVPHEVRHLDFEDAAVELRRLLEETLKLHMVSDVPVGAFLSGGLDSSTTVGLMARISSEPVRTFCMTFGGGAQAYDERGYAERVARQFGTVHQEIAVEPRVAEMLPTVLRHFGQPFGNPTALLVFELSRLVGQHVKVALSGDGGDELFLGYPRYQGLRWHRHLNRLPASVIKGVHASARLIKESTRGHHGFRRLREFLRSTGMSAPDAYASWVSYADRPELLDLVSPAFRDLISDAPWSFLTNRFREGPMDDVVAAAARSDVVGFLPENLLTYSDRMSMVHGLELRVPFCDHVLAEFCTSLSSKTRMKGGGLKALLKEATKDLLPPEILHRPKLGFNPPMGMWLSSELKDLVNERLSAHSLTQSGYLNPGKVAELRREHDAGLRDHSLKLWSMVVLQEWLASL